MAGTLLHNSPTGRAAVPTVMLAVRLDVETRERAVRAALDRGVSLSKLVRDVLAAHFGADAPEARAE